MKQYKVQLATSLAKPHINKNGALNSSKIARLYFQLSSSSLNVPGTIVLAHIVEPSSAPNLILYIQTSFGHYLCVMQNQCSLLRGKIIPRTMLIV